MAFQQDRNPQPVSGTVAISGTVPVSGTVSVNTHAVTVSGTPNVAVTNIPEVTIGDQPVAVTFDQIVTEDTERYFNPTMTNNSDVSVETFLTAGTIVEVLSLSFACSDNNVFAITIKNQTGISDANKLCVLYCVGSINATPNIKHTIASATSLVVHVQRISGSGSANMALSMVYRLTPP